VKQQLLEILGLAETYLDMGATVTAMQHIREAIRIINASNEHELAESEDHGDVSDHLLRRAAC
jgi:hypothetical protein